MVDLRTSYLGLPLAHPVVASASPLSRTLDGIRRLEDGGAAAIVLFSLFEEQIRQERAALDRLTSAGTESFGEALDYFPTVEDSRIGPGPYLELLGQAARSTGVPVIASLNGVTSEGWTEHAALMQEAGAAAIELNIFHIPADLDTSSADVEQRCIDILVAVRRAVSIPVAVKLGPFYSAFGNLARRLVEAGANGLVLFNRFYQPDLDLDALEVAPTLELSRPSEIRLPLLWIAVLHGRIQASLAASTGVQGARRGRQIHPLRCRRGHDHLGSAARGSGPAGDAARRPGRLDGAPRLCLGGTDEGCHEPASRPRPHSLRARELSARAQFLARARDGVLNA